MDRREFLKISGATAATAAIASCTGGVAGNAGKQALDGSHMLCNYPGIGTLGFGAMRWPMMDDSPEEIDQEKVNEMVDYALAHGVNYYDSAPIYLRGKSERATAIALLRHPRESYLIATKCSNFRGEHTFEEGKQMYLQSLANYETDHIDYYLLHSIHGYGALKERFLDNGLLDFFMKEREAGRIRNLGFSFHGTKEGFDELVALHGKYHWDFVQIQMNYSDWKHADRDANAEYMYETLAAMDIPVVIMEPLLGGSLASLPAALADELKAMEPDSSVASWAFRFCGSKKGVLSVLSGMTCMELLKDNLDTYLDFKPLDGEEYRVLEEIAVKMNEYPLVKCTGCRYCMPCPYGIDIPGVFKFYNDNVREGTFVVSSEQKDYARARKKYLLGYSKAVQSVRQADHCIGCGKCLDACPQHIAIPTEMHRIDRYVESLKEGKI